MIYEDYHDHDHDTIHIYRSKQVVVVIINVKTVTTQNKLYNDDDGLWWGQCDVYEIVSLTIKNFVVVAAYLLHHDDDGGAVNRYKSTKIKCWNEIG